MVEAKRASVVIIQKDQNCLSQIPLKPFSNFSGLNKAESLHVMVNKGAKKILTRIFSVAEVRDHHTNAHEKNQLDLIIDFQKILNSLPSSKKRNFF